MISDKESMEDVTTKTSFEKQVRRCIIENTMPQFLLMPLRRNLLYESLLYELRFANDNERNMRYSKRIYQVMFAVSISGLIFWLKTHNRTSLFIAMISGTLFFMTGLLYRGHMDIHDASTTSQGWRMYVEDLHYILNSFYTQGFCPDRPETVLSRFSEKGFSKDEFHRTMRMYAQNFLKIEINRKESGYLLEKFNLC